MADGQVFDVFLSHSSRDKPAVEALARRLADEAHLTPWLDKWHLVPGEPWQEALEQALDQSRTCAVCIGPSGLSPWEREEMRSALETRVSQAGFRVVPVLLPGSTMPERGTLPRFLRRLTWVDFRVSDGIRNAEAFRHLVAGIRGVAPGRSGRATSPGSMSIDSPYRGLEVFDEAHAPLFFGREAMTQQLVETLRGTRFLAVLGPSGSGKSSLVRAGLLPQLRAGALPFSQHWTYLIFKPGAHPLEELALSLAPAEPGQDVLARTRRLLDHMQSDERALHWQVRLALGGRPQEARYCILVDQFEELFTLCQARSERVQFIENLRYAGTIADGRTVILLTMRLDFMPQAAEYTELAEILSGHQFLVSPMDEGDLRRATEEPARLVGVPFEEGLVDTILHDVGREPGMLPLLEHALLQVWERRTADQEMTLQAYRESGGVQGALAQRAEAVFDEFTPEQQDMTRRLILRLTQPGEGTEDTRRRAAMNELLLRPAEQQAVEAVVGRLANARLFTTSVDASGVRQVDVAHEALIRGWPRARRWIDDDRTTLRTHRRLTEAAQEWLRMERDESVLYRGERLAQAQEWREHHEDDLNDLEREFLDTSVVRQERDAEEARERQRRELEQAQALAKEQKQWAKEAEARRQAEERARRERALRQQRHELFQLFGNVPLWAGLLCGLTRMPLTWIFGSFIDPPGAPVEFADDWLKPFMHGFFGTWLGGIFVVFALGALPPSTENMPLRRIMWLIAAGIGWGFIIALVVGWSTHPDRAVGGWAYFMTGACWGVGLALGTQGGNRLGRTSADPLRIWRYRLWGGGCGAFCLLLLPLVMIGLGLVVENKQNLLQRTWGEVLQQSISVSAVLICFYWQQQRFPPSHYDE
jgi:energy-coupling factor transporter ATP-binding protein EcfA2